MNLNGKNAVVIGGAGGIGTEVCRLLLKENICNLAVVDVQDRQAECLKKLNDEFSGKYIVYLKTDIAKLDQLEKTFDNVVEKFGQIDIVINTAGIFNDKDVNATLVINSGAVINASILAVKHMHKETGGKGGVIVNVSSVVGLDPLFLLPVYSASKAAIVSFTRAFCHNYYYTRTGVRFVCVCPGGTLTTFLENFPKKMIYPDEEVALRYFNDFPKQSAEELGRHIIQATANAENGSVWTCDNNVMQQVSFTKYWPRD